MIPDALLGGYLITVGLTLIVRGVSRTEARKAAARAKYDATRYADDLLAHTRKVDVPRRPPGTEEPSAISDEETVE